MKNTNNHLLEKSIDVREFDVVVLDVFNKYETPVLSGGGNNIVNFADAF